MMAHKTTRPKGFTWEDEGQWLKLILECHSAEIKNGETWDGIQDRIPPPQRWLEKLRRPPGDSGCFQLREVRIFFKQRLVMPWTMKDMDEALPKLSIMKD
ncbi:hypothetical protein WISP_18492 [Willisornis vidua]|uniref:Uncharacterized protein n=1 Tax=Willisornis vidua TaxID=1566151 RepID=A0ABQ9DP40_9PASS|nr:hypothetical protein WISP_18492 [Willisornis vidua]